MYGGENWDEQPDLIIVGNQLMKKSHIAYVGLEINKIRNLNEKNSTYTIDFNIWFRFSPDVDADNIEFLNYGIDRLTSGQALKLGKPVEENINEHEIYRLYRMTADFQGNFIFNDYPFDQQSLLIQFRHAYRPRENLMYVVDSLGMGDLSRQGILEKFARTGVFEAISDWRIIDAGFFSDLVTKDSTLGHYDLLNVDTNLRYSRFNVDISVKRNVLAFSLKSLLPLFFFVVVSYLILFLPFEDISIEAVSGILLAVVFFHLSLLDSLPEGVGYIVALDYTFYVLYSLIFLQLTLVVIGRKMMAHDHPGRLQALVRSSRVLYVVILMAAVIIFASRYDIFTPSGEQHHLAAEESQKKEAATDEKSLTVLTLGTFQFDSEKAFYEILSAFEDEHEGIKVQPIFIDPVPYNAVMLGLLRQNNAPDLFLVPPYNVGKKWYRSGYLEPLNRELMQQHYSQDALEAWSAGENDLYALPMAQVVRGIFYNVDLFEQFNLDIPQTWPALLSAAQTLSAAGYLPFANGAGNVDELMYQLVMNLSPTFIGGVEGRKAYLSGQRCFNDGHAESLFQAIASLHPFLSANQAQWRYYDSLIRFADGKAAMWFNGSWGVHWLASRKPGLNWSVFAVPPPLAAPEPLESVEARSTQLSMEPYVGIGLNRASKHKAAAQLLLHWFSTPAAAALYGQKLPGLFTLHRHPVSQANPQARAIQELMDTYPMDVGWGTDLQGEGALDGYNLLAQSAMPVLKGKMTPAEAARAVQEGLAQWFEPAQNCDQRTAAEDRGRN